MAITRYWQFDAWKLAEAFKLEAFRLVKGSPAARGNYKFKSQLIESARGPGKHIAEGFLRKSPRVFAQYLDYAASSAAEARDHLRDGIQLEYFAEADCTKAFQLGKRCVSARIKLKQAQLRYKP